MSEQAASPVQAQVSEVGRGRRPLTGRQKLGLYVVVGALVLGVVLFHNAGPRAPREEKPEGGAILGTGEPFHAPPAIPTAAALPPPLPMPATQAAPLLAAVPRQAEDPGEKARESDILGGSAAPAEATGALATLAPQATAAGQGGDNTVLGGLLKPTVLEGSRASVLPHPDFTITMGTPFPCIPQEPITSDAPGLVSCIVPVDVRGTTGRVVLLDRGTKIVGTVQQALMQGHSRLFVLWQRAETPNPNHVIITLNSPAADELGEAGLDGDLNTHFWQRFGGAIMLSFIDSGLQAAAQLASNGGSTFTFNSFSSNGQSAASVALQNTINIPPTLHRDQALPATVFVARDLDFSDVYALRLRGDP